MKPKNLLFVVLFFFSVPLFSQDFGGFAPGIQWKQINTKPVRVIFPEGLESQAQRVANLVVYMDQNNRASIGPLGKKLDLVLNNQGIIPNGYVGLGPFRSEFYTIPLQESKALGSLPWLDLLSVHEYRHAMQFTNYRKGITRLGYFLSGEMFWSVAINLSTPNWYFEGDAVLIETALTAQGRGRIPSFNQGFKSISGSGKTYSYDRVRNGSYRLDIPDHYRLGYLLCAYGREKYGEDLWLKVTDESARFKGVIYPFSKALLRNTGLKSNQFYQEAFAHYQALWESERSPLESPSTSTLNKPFRTVTHYDYPVFDPQGDQILAVKSSFKKTAAIVGIEENGDETRIVELGMHLEPYFSAGTDFLIWSELSWDYRFFTKSYSDLVVFNRQTGKKSYLTHNGRYFSPAISPDQSQIAALFADEFMAYELRILDRETGAVLAKLPNPDQYYFTYPQWSLDGKTLYTTARTTDQRMTVLSIDPGTGRIAVLLDPVNHILGKVSVGTEKLFLSTSLEGTEDITALDLKTGALQRVSRSNYGASNPAIYPDQNQLCYSAYYHTGSELEVLNLATDPPQSIQVTPLDKLPQSRLDFLDSEGGEILSRIPEETYKIRNYSPVLRSLKVHSWSPVATLASLGLGLISDNVLNNIHLEAGYQYYLNEASSGFSVAAVYGQYLPIISLEYSQGFRNPGSGVADNLKVWESTIAFGVEIPLDFSKGLYNRTVVGGLSIENTTTPSVPGLLHQNGDKVRFGSAGIHSQFQITKQRALQNISTPLGVGGELLFNRSFTNLRASQIQLYLDGSIRGLFPNQNLVVGFSYKKESVWNPYQYLDLNTYPRGYEPAGNSWLATWQVNYHFPLFYPDLGAAGLFYVMRVRANIFADFGIGDIIHPGTGNLIPYTFPSFGGELIFDLNLFRLIPGSIGFRLTALGQTDLYEPGRSSLFQVFIPVLRL